MAFKKFTNSERQLRGDPRFNNRLATKFINCMMWEGKKSVAQRVFYDAMDRIAEKITDTPPIDVFAQAIENVKPDVEVRSRRVGGANYQVPMAVGRKRQQSLAIRWLLEASRSKSGKSMEEKLAEQLIAASRKEGDAMTTRENVHKMAEANKAFAHFAW